MIPIITGPTASGKTDFILNLSKKLNVEIISADAYQVYKYMDIGTAKPTIEERAQVKHYLIDILTPDQTYSAGDFFEHAEKLIEKIIQLGKFPIIVGGTGLYVETLQKGIFEGPPRNDEIRNNLRTKAKKLGLKYLYNHLKKIDPDYASKISENDQVRIIRALEVYETLKIPFSIAHKLYHKKPKYRYKVFVFYRERTQLYERIDKRVDKMIEAGWIDEVKHLMKLGYSKNLPSMKAIGYQEIIEFLESKYTLEYTVDKIKKRTRNFAKRQFTWFRHMENVSWVDVSLYNLENLIYEIIKTYDI
ncbi:tRNA (adenosine(37)-N6)-dimethylallyltransferase MiaA [Deferribacter thermophilus]|uniref:tRNA (adenosine(37)-N6)-dimethylallyltransferase MiaA n=1 Tax=Deferribacter thermophilus TaxID=53573 RepID=UPI003C182155